MASNFKSSARYALLTKDMQNTFDNQEAQYTWLIKA